MKAPKHPENKTECVNPENQSEVTNLVEAACLPGPQLRGIQTGQAIEIPSCALEPLRVVNYLVGAAVDKLDIAPPTA